MLKKTIITLYVVVVAVMAATTIVEKYQGTDYVQTHYYGSWWFALLWAVLAAAAVAGMVRQKMRRWPVVLLHLSLLLILAGALLTRLLSSQGYLHLRVGETTATYQSADADGGIHKEQLPFRVRLDAFNIDYHDGTDAAADYTSRITVNDGQHKTRGEVSMNNIFSYSGYRFYQSSYDDDGKGTTLALNADPWGIGVTYTGYALLFFSLIYMLIDPKGTFRRLLRQVAGKPVVTVLFLMATMQMNAAPHVLPAEDAELFGRLHLLYNERICPMQTYALDFTKKLCGKRHYKEYTAEQVLTGFIFWPEEWSNETVVKVKGGELRRELKLNAYCSVNDLFRPDAGYILGPYIQQYANGNNDAIYKQAAQVDDKLRLVMELRRGKPFRVFPQTVKGVTTWLSPTGKLPKGTSKKNEDFIRLAFSTLNYDARNGNFEHFRGAVNDMRRFQQNNGGDSLPTPLQIRAERTYNMIPFATILFMVNLTAGFITLFWMLFRLAQKRSRSWEGHLFCTILTLSFGTLSYGMVLRWIVSGTIPMANGYETMLLMAWLVMLIAVFSYVRLYRIYRKGGTDNMLIPHLLLLFGFLLSGFFLLVSHISQMDPKIGRIMPVLNSPLLSIHVSIIMMAYALLSLTFICAMTAIGIHLVRKTARRRTATQLTTTLHILSQLFLYPALTCLGLGIFIGAIWANISWGRYWSWDPKETWALITFMLYAVPVHARSLPLLGKPMPYHVYMAVAFLSILMTYFGVNYFLGGMHSYA